ncbi:adenylate cyclase [Sinorhizobium sp. RAC02]|uniref:adenylate cyclase n=1 Tax=Sinorhizobium sp. RAC02 TaxID=1842534 RepID=UPI00083E5D75|nr:adenylate cyclase [Sinorhizobium sp. RAC02]
MIYAAYSGAEGSRPDTIACRGQLARIRQSAAFDATERECRLLEYVVEETLAGRGNRIKAYSIALEVFGRSDAFDPQADPIVRIAASHLRRALERYYLTSGKADPIVIGIPKGSYVPSFSIKSIPNDGQPNVDEQRCANGGTLERCAGSPMRPPPGAQDVRAQLQRLDSSLEFPKTGRVGLFLTYIVEETLAGREARIKGHSIAIEVFKRSESFSQDDPVVRIEAGRLRRALERYYLVAGQNDPVRINVPKGGYVPVFSWHNESSEAPPRNQLRPFERAGPTTGALWQGRSRLLFAIVAIAGLGASAHGISRWTIEDTAIQQADMLGVGLPTLIIAPFANLGNGPDAQIHTNGLTEELLTALPRFKEIRVLSRETSQSLPSDVGMSQARDGGAAPYLLSGGVQTTGSRIRVTARLLDTSNGAILWSKDYENDLRSRDLFAIQTDVANKVAATIAQPYGIIAQASNTKLPPDDLGVYACTLNFYTYRKALSAERHADVRNCLEGAVARYPGYATAWAILSVLYLDEERFGFNPKSDDAAPLQRALQAARSAIQLDPANVRGLQALMTALFFDRQVAEAIRVGEQALAANPNDTELIGEFGTRLAIAGQWDRGAALLDQALALNPGGDGHYHGTRVLAAHMLGDSQAAVFGAGLREDARQASKTFTRMRPDFLRNIAAELKIGKIPSKDQVSLLSVFRKAGMPVSGSVAPVRGSAAAVFSSP